MKKSIFIVLAFILTACATSPTPQVTATPEATVTLAPIPTPTPHPQFAALQEQIAASGTRFTLSGADGLVYDGETPMPGLHVSPNGTTTLTVNGETVALDPAKAVFDDEGGFSYPGYEYDQSTGEWVVEVRQFAECAFKDYRSCPVPIEDTQAKQDYVRSKVTPEMFNLGNLKYLKMSTYSLGAGRVITPSAETAPNYTGENADRAPFIKDNNWNGVTDIDGVTHSVINIPYVVEDGMGGYDVIVMTGLRPMKGGGYDISNADEFDNRMNVIPWRIDQQSIELATRFINPATNQNFTSEEVTVIIEEMIQGNFANADGLVLFFEIGKSSGGWFE